MRVLAIDPGPTESAYAIYNGRIVERFEKVPNNRMNHILTHPSAHPCDYLHSVVIEQIASMGMAVGEEVFETCVWTGRFIESADRAGLRVNRVKRTEVKMHLCGSMQARDSNIRQALIDRFGGKDEAIGKKKNPGPLYGVSGDVWSALAVGLTWMDRQAN